MGIPYLTERKARRLCPLLVLISFILFYCSGIPVGAQASSFAVGSVLLFESADAKKTLTMELLNHVSGIAADSYSSQSCTLSDSSSYMGTAHASSTVDVVLSLGDTKTTVSVEFVDHKFLRMIVYSYEYRGQHNASQTDPLLEPGTKSDTITLASNALNKYRELTNATHIDSYVPLLTLVSDPTKSQNVTQNDLTLRLTHKDEKNSTDMFFVRSFYGIPAVGTSLEISGTGCVTALTDWASVYRISETQVSVTEESAVQMALANATEYISSIGAQIVKTKSSLLMISGRHGEPLLLCPQWQVTVSFDKSYDGGVNGYYVGLWADTGEISSSFPQGSYGSNEPAPLSFWFLVPPLVVAVLLVAFIFLRKRDKRKAN